MPSTESIHPVVASERIHSVDALRGFSLLGILLLNIVSFGMPFVAYMSPAAYGGAEGINFTTWLIAMTFWDGKMRCIFSMLFGTSAILMLERAEKRGAGIDAADIYYRRTMWLIVFGLFHAHLIWGGDILYGYGVVGLLLFPFRKAPAYALILTGVVLITIHSLQNLGAGFALKEIAAQANEARTIQSHGGLLTAVQMRSGRPPWRLDSKLETTLRRSLAIRIHNVLPNPIPRYPWHVDPGHGACQGECVRRFP